MLNNLPMIMAECLILTVIIECALAFVLGVRTKYDMIFTALANVFTNPLVVASAFLAGFLRGSSFRAAVLVIAEIFAVTAEAVIYSKTLEYKKIRPFFLSLILNGASFGTGLIINQLTGG